MNSVGHFKVIILTSLKSHIPPLSLVLHESPDCMMSRENELSEHLRIMNRRFTKVVGPRSEYIKLEVGGVSPL